MTLQLSTKPNANDYVVSMVSKQFPAAVMAYGLANMASLYAGYVNPAGPFNPFKYVDPQLDALYQQYIGPPTRKAPPPRSRSTRAWWTRPGPFPWSARR